MEKVAFKGYLARRAFRALKGIIRLQALTRGHLVRRQAITTLCCMMGIVKLQVHARGVMARHSDAMDEEGREADPIGERTFDVFAKIDLMDKALMQLIYWKENLIG